MDKSKIEVIDKFPPPTSVKGIKSFLGHHIFYRRFIKDFSKIAKPLCMLLEHDRLFNFDEDYLKARDGKILHGFGAPWSPTPNGEIFEQFLGNGVGSGRKIIPKFLTG